MDNKVGNIVKAIVATPTMEPVRDVEYGCEHLQLFLENEDVAEKLTNAFTDLQNILSHPIDAQAIKDSKDPKKDSITTLRPTYLCLQCKTVSSLKDRDSHSDAKKHPFSIDSRHGCLYCWQCEDFIYDPAFERIRSQQSILPKQSGKKRKASSTFSQIDIETCVIPNSNTLSCQAGGPRGMYNLGHTCYMSVVLQALIHNPLMRNYFLSNRHDSIDCAIDNCMACALTTSFTEILATEKVDGHGPVEVLYKTWHNHEDLQGYKQQDAHDFWGKVVNDLHISSGCTMGYGSKTCTCLYHQTFFGKLRDTLTCLKCRAITASETETNGLDLNLYQIAAKRRKANPKQTNVDAPLKLTTCLKNYTSPERLGTERKCGSVECGNTIQKAKKHVTIKKLPPSLCLQMMRYESDKTGAQKLNTKIDFPLQLDMSPYTTRAHKLKKKSFEDKPANYPPLPSPLAPRSPGWYDLSSVVVHIGQMSGGHYITYCRKEERWFKFDDSKVTTVSEAEVLDAEAYILFYVVRRLGISALNEKE